MNKKSRFAFLYPALLVFVGAILFSTKAILVKLGYRYDVDGVTLLALRMLFSLPLYIGALYWLNRQKQKQATNISRKEWFYAFLLGITGYYLASLMDFLGLQYISASIERLILFTYPTMVLIFSVIFFRQHIKGIQVFALLLTYLGITLALIDDVGWEANPKFFLGAFFVFLSAFFFALYILFGGQLVQKFGTLRFTATVMLSASVAVLSHHLIVNGWNFFDLPFPVYIYGLLMALFATFFPSFMVSEGLRQIGSSNTAIISSIGPVSTILLAYIFLEERLSNWQWLGTALVIAGVLVISLQKKKD